MHNSLIKICTTYMVPTNGSNHCLLLLIVSGQLLVLIGANYTSAKVQNFEFH